MKEEYSLELIDNNHQLLDNVEQQFHVVKQFCEVFDNKEQKLLINRMEELALVQPTSIIEYDKQKKELGEIQKKFNDFDKKNIQPIKKTLDLIKKTTALAYEKFTTERIKQLKKEKENEAIAIGLLMKEVKVPVAEKRKTSFQEGVELLASLIEEYKEDKVLVTKLEKIYQLLMV